ncbi:MAG: peptidoglycan-binding domain-containing protein [Hyphomicrobiaceae bacterium]|nr:peptidoglycan-binding domain-containing protein [Hyphomicrobiaceae bacterium]
MRTVRRTAVVLSTALLAALSLGSPVTAAEKTCQDFVEITGPAAALRSAAPKKARKRWQDEVTQRYGAAWANWDLAETKDDRFNCGYTSGVLWRCGARARPCMSPVEAGAAAGGTPAAATCATLAKPKPKCNDKILALQTQLATEGCPSGDPDGLKGAATRDALRCYQKKKGLPQTGDTDAATTAALAKP